MSLIARTHHKIGFRRCDEFTGAVYRKSMETGSDTMKQASTRAWNHAGRNVRDLCELRSRSFLDMQSA